MAASLTPDIPRVPALEMVRREISSSRRDIDFASRSWLGDAAAAPLCAAIRDRAAFLRRLHISHCGLSDITVVMIAETLAAMGERTLVQELSMWDNDRIGPASAAALATCLRMPSLRLQTLSLAATSIGDEGMVTIVDALVESGNTALTALDVAATKIGAVGFRALARLTRCTSSLKTLVAGRNPPPPHDDTPEAVADRKAVVEMVSALATNRSVKVLSLVRNDLDDSVATALAAALARNATLETLDLTSNLITDEGVVAIATVLSSNANTRLRALSVKLNLYGAVGASALAAAVASSRSLEHLRVQWTHCSRSSQKREQQEQSSDNESPDHGVGRDGNDGAPSQTAIRKETAFSDTYHNETIQAEGAIPPAPAPPVPSMIPSLISNVPNRSWTREEGAAAGAELGSAISASGRLLTLHIDESRLGPTGASAFVPTLTTLRSLSLGSNAIGASGAAALASGLAATRTLAKLHLGNNGIGDAGAVALATAFAAAGAAADTPSTLTTLNLASNGIGAAGAEALARALPAMRALTHLTLSHNDIGDAGATALAEIGLPGHPTLMELFLAGNRIGDDGARALARATHAAAAPPLCRLMLPANALHDVGEAFAAAVSDPRCELQVLDLGTQRLARDGARALAAAAQRSKTLTRVRAEAWLVADVDMEAVLEQNRARAQRRDEACRAILVAGRVVLGGFRTRRRRGRVVGDGDADGDERRAGAMRTVFALVLEEMWRDAAGMDIVGLGTFPIICAAVGDRRSVGRLVDSEFSFNEFLFVACCRVFMQQYAAPVGPESPNEKFTKRVKLERRDIEKAEGTGLVISAVMDSECKECFGMANSVLINDARAIFTDMTLVDADGLEKVTVADDGTIEADVADKMALVDWLIRKGFTICAPFALTSLFNFVNRATHQIPQLPLFSSKHALPIQLKSTKRTHDMPAAPRRFARVPAAAAAAATNATNTPIPAVANVSVGPPSHRHGAPNAIANTNTATTGRPTRAAAHGTPRSAFAHFEAFAARRTFHGRRSHSIHRPAGLAATSSTVSPALHDVLDAQVRTASSAADTAVKVRPLLEGCFLRELRELVEQRGLAMTGVAKASRDKLVTALVASFANRWTFNQYHYQHQPHSSVNGALNAGNSCGTPSRTTTLGGATHHRLMREAMRTHPHSLRSPPLRAKLAALSAGRKKKAAGSVHAAGLTLAVNARSHNDLSDELRAWKRAVARQEIRRSLEQRSAEQQGENADVEGQGQTEIERRLSKKFKIAETAYRKSLAHRKIAASHPGRLPELQPTHQEAGYLKPFDEPDLPTNPDNEKALFSETNIPAPSWLVQSRLNLGCELQSLEKSADGDQGASVVPPPLSTARTEQLTSAMSDTSLQHPQPQLLQQRRQQQRPLQQQQLQQKQQRHYLPLQLPPQQRHPQQQLCPQQEFQRHQADTSLQQPQPQLLQQQQQCPMLQQQYQQVEQQPQRSYLPQQLQPPQRLPKEQLLQQHELQPQQANTSLQQPQPQLWPQHQQQQRALLQQQLQQQYQQLEQQQKRRYLQQQLQPQQQQRLPQQQSYPQQSTVTTHRLGQQQAGPQLRRPLQPTVVLPRPASLLQPLTARESVPAGSSEQPRRQLARQALRQLFGPTTFEPVPATPAPKPKASFKVWCDPPGGSATTPATVAPAPSASASTSFGWKAKGPATGFEDKENIPMPDSWGAFAPPTLIYAWVAAPDYATERRMPAEATVILYARTRRRDAEQSWAALEQARQRLDGNKALLVMQITGLEWGIALPPPTPNSSKSTQPADLHYRIWGPAGTIRYGDKCGEVDNMSGSTSPPQNV
ncbi:hypothetical protein DFJ73DRAFT_759088 [Zopfochytrium polystomum]|nr:hypothetical protein DFJ73DRAFT_759088 [Zopfochytrium polystomum]